MTIQITRPEIEALIQQQLKAGGFSSPEDVILHALEAAMNTPQSAPSKKTGLEKALAFERWAKGHRHTPPLSDEAVSRASLIRDVR